MSFPIPVASSLEELDRQISTLMRKCQNEEGYSVWQCDVCGQRIQRKNDIKRHIEAKHLIFPGVTCNLCERVYKTRNSLRKHSCISGQK